MKRCKWWVCALVLFAFTAAPVLAAEGEETQDKPEKKKRERKPAKPKSVLRGEHAMLVKAAELTEEQKAKLEEQVKANNEAVAAWKQANGEKMKELQKAYADARKAKDKEAMAKAREEMKPLLAEQTRLHTELWKGINEMLSPEQKAKYEAFKFYRMVLGRFGKAKLTAEQEATVKSLCAEPGKAYAAEKDRKAKNKILRDLQKKIHDEVLTDQQREALKKPREKKPAPDKTEPVVKD